MCRRRRLILARIDGFGFEERSCLFVGPCCRVTVGSAQSIVDGTLFGKVCAGVGVLIKSSSSRLLNDKGGAIVHGALEL